MLQRKKWAISAVIFRGTSGRQKILGLVFFSLKPNTVYYYQTAATEMREEEGRLDRAWAALEEEATQMEHQARGAEEEVDRLEIEVERPGGEGGGGWRGAGNVWI